MAGAYLNKNIIIDFISSWEHRNINWENNNLHIDEIKSLKKIKHDDWAATSLMVLNIIPDKVKIKESKILFLHLDLEYSEFRMSINNLSLEWLKANISEFTPPSFNYTSIEYYSEFYTKELNRCEPDFSILNFFDSSEIDFNFFYRTFWDEEEGLHSREIYIFPKFKFGNI